MIAYLVWDFSDRGMSVSKIRQISLKHLIFILKSKRFKRLPLRRNLWKSVNLEVRDQQLTSNYLMK